MHLSLPRVVLAVALCSVAVPAQDTPITFRSEPTTLAALESAAPNSVAAVREWLPFATDCGYRLVLSDDGRTLLLLSDTFTPKNPKKEHREVEVMLGLVRGADSVVEGFLPPTAPETAPHVIIGCRTEHYPRLLDRLAVVDPELKEWTERAAPSVTGFVLSEPLVAAWIEDPVGVEEWNPHNELVHRTSQLMIRGRAGALPPWLLLGLAWHVEDTVCRSIYCFPHRAGFVATGAHTDWGLWLASEFKKGRREKANRSSQLEIDEFADWRPNAGSAEFEEAKAYVSFGVARFLAHEHADKIAQLAVQLDAATQKGRTVWISPTEWTTNPDYQVPASDQHALLREVDPKFLATVTAYFQKRKANEVRAVKATR